MRALVECGKILASSLECEKTFPELAEFIVSRFADSCSIFVKGDDTLVRMASAQRLPMEATTEPDEANINRILLSAEPEIAGFPTSRVLLPILVQNAVAGVLAATSAKAGAFDSEDIHFFTAIGHRAGLALDNARLLLGFRQSR